MRKIIFYIVMLIVLVSCGKNEPVTTVNDVCGNTYKIVTIGTQTWMAENLRCNKYDTQSEAYNATWLTNNAVPTYKYENTLFTPYYSNAADTARWGYFFPFVGDCSRRLTSEQIAKLGYLYNWSAAVGVDNVKNQTSAFTGNRQGICPNGWHIPTKEEWKTLYDYIYNDQELSDNEVGKYLKTTSGWHDYVEGYKPGTDSYDFSALPSGYAWDSIAYFVGHSAYFWTATTNEDDSAIVSAYYISLYWNYDYLSVYNFENNKLVGQSVRCVKN